MPEIKNEVPTDAELRHYLLESFPAIADDFTFRLPEFMNWDGNEAACLDYAVLPGFGFNEFWQQAVETIYQALQRLNQLPRTDPLWRNSNRRPTMFKLYAFSRELFRDQPDEVNAHWTYAALSVFSASADFGETVWKALHRLGHFDATWPVFAALLTELVGYPTAERLARLLGELEAGTGAGPLLVGLSQSDGPTVAPWAATVLRLLK